MSAQSNGELRSVNDGELLARFSATGDQQAFSHLVARHGPMVLRMCRRIFGGDPHGAEDAAQEVFLMLASRANALKTRMCVAGWLYRTAWHVATRQRRNTAVRADHETLAGIERAATAAAAAADGSEEPIPFAVASFELSDALGRALGNLPETYRNALVLHHVAGYTVEETAAMLGVKVGTAASWMSRGRVMMRDRLGTLVVGGVTGEAVVGWFYEHAPAEGMAWGDAGGLTHWSASGAGQSAIAVAAARKTTSGIAAAAGVATPAYACGKAAGILAAVGAGAMPTAKVSGAVLGSAAAAAVAGAGAASAASGAGSAGTAASAATAVGVAKAAAAVAAVAGAAVAGGAALTSGGDGGDWRGALLPRSPSSSSSSASTSVPEPSVALPLMLMGAFVLLGFRGRRRRPETA